MAGRKTNSKTVLIFIVASIVAVLALAYLFKPPPRVRPAAAATTD